MYSVTPNFSLHSVRELIEDNKELVLGKFLRDENISKDAVIESTINNLSRLICREDVSRLALIDNKETIKGVMIVERSKWDTEILGLDIGRVAFVLFRSDTNVTERRILIEESLKTSVRKGIKLVFSRVPLNDLLTINAIQKEGSTFVDNLLTYYVNPRQIVIPKVELSNVRTVKAGESDANALSEIAREAFRMSHFHADSKLPRNRCDELYVKWVLNCLHGLADTVLAAQKNSKIVGFITCKINNIDQKNSYGVIDLIGVSREHRREKIGLLLLSEALKWFSKRTRSVYVGTQDVNIPAIRLYEKARFRLTFPMATFHHHLTGKPAHLRRSSLSPVADDP